jgi:hypothetical protein
MRFHLFLSIEEWLKEMDYLFFFNANYTFTETIDEEELLPKLEDNFLTGQIHPVAYHKRRKEYDYDTNSGSTAYIAPGAGSHYFAGGLIGGRTTEFLRLCRQLRNNIDKDFENNVMAKWHDESHINNYFSVIAPKKLHPGYCYPEGWYLPFHQKTLLLDKNRLGGHGFLRGTDSGSGYGIFQRVLFKIKLVVRAAIYKLIGFSPV